MEGSMGDKVLNKFGERAQIWAAVSDNEDILNGKVILRARANFLTARREAFNYVQALEKTVKEVEEANEKLHDELADMYATKGEMESIMSGLRTTVMERERDLSEARKEIERRNRTKERGPDEIGAEYILRLGIPELTEVFNRTVLGKNRG